MIDFNCSSLFTLLTLHQRFIMSLQLQTEYFPLLLVKVFCVLFCRHIFGQLISFIYCREQCSCCVKNHWVRMLGSAVNRYTIGCNGDMYDKVAVQRVLATVLYHTCRYHGDQSCHQINQGWYHTDYKCKVPFRLLTMQFLFLLFKFDCWIFCVICLFFVCILVTIHI